ncbi:Abi family protein, partial [Rothia sp. (in: high G+C Gram-positive bacteria)]|uniref:Abi family protein n=1 Tax=Rothia sp. (in: high G+C Gram-positive bacteria) TaxID=1885016 RepID=UPI0032167D94
MPHPLKPYKTIAEQIDLLRSRKMIIDDQSLAEQWLQTVGYYRLSGYWYTRRVMNPPGSPTYRGDDFMPDTKFSDIAKLYEFDRKLRTQVHDGIERVEIALRTALAETLGGIDRLAFYNRDNFRIRKHNEYAHYDLISTVSSRVNRALKAKDSFHIRHNVEKYGTQLAPWVLMDVFDFSDLSKLFKLLNADEQSEVAALVGINTRTLRLFPAEAKDLRKDHP